MQDTENRRQKVLLSLFTADGKPKPNLEQCPPLNSAQVAMLFQMSERTIRTWAAKGTLPHRRTLGGGRIHYPARQIADIYLKKYAVEARNDS